MHKNSTNQTKVPSQFQGFLWSAKVENLDIEKDKTYIINQALSLGTLPMIKWLFQAYSSQTVKDIFINHPIKDYTDSRFYLVKNFLLNLQQHHLNPNRYVKNLPRDLG